ncbi:DUF7388 family protein [Halovivax gelatinilyticus]|uniref:DUF7388 family protein n=1 Tax=Halovivax gelatinilyticus TaxID=2961597 RepID=UPI0020CA8608|nr:luciferase [Halovivax gelatinilyticus]
MLNEVTSGDSRPNAIGLDGVAVKPTESDLYRIDDLPVETIAIDYEGTDTFPDRRLLDTLAKRHNVRVTTPIRADGFDPLGDESLVSEIPDAVGRVLVAGHPAYLTDRERRRAVAPRLGSAVDSDPGAWVGTESVERIALATGAPQFELLSRTTEREIRALRAAGFTGEIAVYAPTVCTDDHDAILDAVGAYVGRRRPISRSLPEGAPTDSTATGDVRTTLLEGAKTYALVGDESTVRESIERLRAVGVTTVIGYPARGLDALFEEPR